MPLMIAYSPGPGAPDKGSACASDSGALIEGPDGGTRSIFVCIFGRFVVGSTPGLWTSTKYPSSSLLLNAVRGTIFNLPKANGDLTGAASIVSMMSDRMRREVPSVCFGTTLSCSGEVATRTGVPA